MDLITAHWLAGQIEKVSAQRCVDAKNSRPGRGPRRSWEDEYDPLTATCLGDLIYNIANKSSRTEVKKMRAALEAALNWFTPPNDHGPFPAKQIANAIGEPGTNSG